MHMIWELLFPLALPFLTFAEGNGNEGGDSEEDSDDIDGNDDGEEDREEESDDSKEPDAKKLKASLALTQADLKRVKAEARKRRVKLEKYEKEEAERKKAAMGDLEKAQTDLAEATTERDRLRVEMTDLRIRYAIEIGAAGLQFVDPKDAFNLLDLGEIEIDEDTGEVSGVDKALKALMKAKPYLVTPEESDSLGTPSAKRKAKLKKDALPERSMANL